MSHIGFWLSSFSFIFQFFRFTAEETNLSVHQDDYPSAFYHMVKFLYDIVL